MPFTRWYYPSGTLSQDDKDAIAEGIADIYASAYPKNAVVVVFLEIAKGNFYTGGQVNEKFHRIYLQHMSGTYDTKTLENDVRMRWRKVFEPYVEGRGHAYELQIDEIPPSQISLNNYITRQVLSEPLWEKMVQEDKIYSGHLVIDGE